MATNWNVKDAYNAIITGKKEDIIDLGHRFPLALNVLSKIGEANPAVELINALPEHVTVRKIEQVLKGDADGIDAVLSGLLVGVGFGVDQLQAALQVLHADAGTDVVLAGLFEE